MCSFWQLTDKQQRLHAFLSVLQSALPWTEMCIMSLTCSQLIMYHKWWETPHNGLFKVDFSMHLGFLWILELSTMLIIFLSWWIDFFFFPQCCTVQWMQNSSEWIHQYTVATTWWPWRWNRTELFIFLWIAVGSIRSVESWPMYAPGENYTFLFYVYVNRWKTSYSSVSNALSLRLFCEEVPQRCVLFCTLPGLRCYPKG